MRLMAVATYNWSVSIMSYSCGGCEYPDVVTLSGLCMNYEDSSGLTSAAPVLTVVS